LRTRDHEIRRKTRRMIDCALFSVFIAIPFSQRCLRAMLPSGFASRSGSAVRRFATVFGYSGAAYEPLGPRLADLERRNRNQNDSKERSRGPVSMRISFGPTSTTSSIRISR
jgi:hypothetical protein